MPQGRLHDWPAPPHFRIAASAQAAEPEPAMVSLLDGRKLLGHVLRVDSGAGIVDFQDDHVARQAIVFTAIKSLYLTRPVDLEPVALEMPGEFFEAPAPQLTRKCHVRFKSGGELECDISGFTPRADGLYLYIAQGTRSLRWFIPASTFERYQVGERLGQALIDRHLVDSNGLEAGLERQRNLRSARFGDYLARLNIVLPQQLERALENQKTLRHLRLGDALIQEGLITAEQRDHALGLQAADRARPLGEILADMGMVDRDAVRHVLVEQLGVPFVRLRNFPFAADALAAIPAELARRLAAVPLRVSASRLVVAIENPMACGPLQEITRASGLKVDPVMAAHGDLLEAVARLYPAEAAAEVRVLADA